MWRLLSSPRKYKKFVLEIRLKKRNDRKEGEVVRWKDERMETMGEEGDINDPVPE